MEIPSRENLADVKFLTSENIFKRHDQMKNLDLDLDET